MFFVNGLSQLIGSVCVSSALAVVALLSAAWLRRWTEGLGATAADAADGD
jgi:hypothetical protein